MNKRNDLVRAWERYADAFALDPTDARVLFEADQLDKKMGVAPAERLARLARHMHLVDQRDDLTVEYVTLLNLTGRHDEALARLLARTFHPWEGGEGKVTGQYVTALVELAKGCLVTDDVAAAIGYLERARSLSTQLGRRQALRRTGESDRLLSRLCVRADETGRSGGRALCGGGDWFRRAGRRALLQRPAARHDPLPGAGPAQAWRSAGGRCHRAGAGRLRRDRMRPIPSPWTTLPSPCRIFWCSTTTWSAGIGCTACTWPALGIWGWATSARAATCFDAVLAEDPAHLGAVLHRRINW